MHCPFEAMLVCVRWYAAYPRSFRHIEERMIESGVLIDHSTVHRRVLKIPPVLALVFRRANVLSCAPSETTLRPADLSSAPPCASGPLAACGPTAKNEQTGCRRSSTTITPAENCRHSAADLPLPDLAGTT